MRLSFLIVIAASVAACAPPPQSSGPQRVVYVYQDNSNPMAGMLSAPYENGGSRPMVQPRY